MLFNIQQKWRINELYYKNGSVRKKLQAEKLLYIAISQSCILPIDTKFWPRFIIIDRNKEP